MNRMHRLEGIDGEHYQKAILAALDHFNRCLEPEAGKVGWLVGSPLFPPGFACGTTYSFAPKIRVPEVPFSESRPCTWHVRQKIS